MNRIWLALLLLAMAGIMSACPGTPEQSKKSYYKGEGISYELKYFQDTRTDVCYAWNGFNSYSLTQVPCTEKVLSQIK